MGSENTISLFESLLTSQENEVIEFKQGKADELTIGKYISTLSNSACKSFKKYAYLVFGVKDDTKEIVGVNFKLNDKKVGSESLSFWLNKMLDPKTDFKLYDFDYSGKQVSFIRIAAAEIAPIKFQNIAKIRVDSQIKNLNSYPNLEKIIWDNCKGSSFEMQAAMLNVNYFKISELLDIESLYQSLDIIKPPSEDAIISKLVNLGLILSSSNQKNSYHITNMGALSLAKDLSHFESVALRGVRVINYDTKSKAKAFSDEYFSEGYALSFLKIFKEIYDSKNLKTGEESFEEGIRQNQIYYSKTTLRELLINSMVHQDFNEHQNGPIIEIYPHKIVFINSGYPMIKTERFLDLEASRNSKLVNFFNKLGICEDRGSGIDRIYGDIEARAMPAISYQLEVEKTKATLSFNQDFEKMTKKDKILSCFQHCAFKYIEDDYMNNSSLTRRFNLKNKSSSVISKIIKMTLEANLIKPADPDNHSKRHASYVPFWHRYEV
jgi:predicted HTH transcriptional regulator